MLNGFNHRKWSNLKCQIGYQTSHWIGPLYYDIPLVVTKMIIVVDTDGWHTNSTPPLSALQDKNSCFVFIM